MPNRLHPRRQEAVELVRSGMHPRDVSEKIICSYDAVLVWCREAGVTFKKKTGGCNRSLTPQQEKKLIELSEQGVSYTNLATRFGLSKAGAAHYVRRAKVSRNTSPEPSATPCE